MAESILVPSVNHQSQWHLICPSFAEIDLVELKGNPINYRLLIIGGVIAIALHLLLLTLPVEYNLLSHKMDGKKSFAVQLLPQKLQTKTEIPIANQSLPEQKRESFPEGPRERPIAQQKKTISEPTKMVSAKAVKQPKLTVQDLMDKIAKPDTHAQNLPEQTQQPQSIIFPSAFSNQLNAEQRKQEKYAELKSQLIEGQQQKYFEFQAGGGQTIVRIDGRCFIVPEKDPFAIEQPIWASMGKC